MTDPETTRPVAPDCAEPHDAPQPDAPQRVLLVDDEPAFLDSVAQRLELRGFTPRTADSGEACLDALAAEPAAVVVLDVRLPGMDGLETLDRIKAEHPGTEVVLLTGHANTADGVRGMKLGAFDYLAKPVEIDHLARKIRQAHDSVERREERRREAEFRSRMAQRMAEAQRLAAIGTLATGVAHEINNPLAVINDAAGWLRTLAARLEDPDARPDPKLFAKGLDSIEKSVRRARAITHQLLGYARGHEDAVGAVQPLALLDDILELLRKEARNRDIEVRVATDGEPGRLTTDADRLRQVLVNLVTNAIQAVDSDGAVTITVRDLPATQDAAARVAFEVVDDGPGMPPEVVEHVFDPFYSTKPQGKGTGLGLFVSRGIAEKLGGELTAASEPGAGAVFTLTLPRAFPGFADAD